MEGLKKKGGIDGIRKDKGLMDKWKD